MMVSCTFKSFVLVFVLELFGPVADGMQAY